jgi:hypothetical protein
MHEAARICGHEGICAASACQLLVGHRHGDLRLADRKRPAEATAQIRPWQWDEPRAGAFQQAAGLVGDPKLAQHVARVVVSKRAAGVSSGERRLRPGEEGGELPDLVPLAAQELGQVVRGHGRAGPGRTNDGTVSGEGSDERARDAARGSAMTRVERGLSAADLLQGKVDLVAGLFEQGLGVGDDLREEKIPQASGE